MCFLKISMFNVCFFENTKHFLKSISNNFFYRPHKHFFKCRPYWKQFSTFYHIKNIFESKHQKQFSKLLTNIPFTKGSFLLNFKYRIDFQMEHFKTSKRHKNGPSTINNIRITLSLTLQQVLTKPDHLLRPNLIICHKT